MNQQEFKKWMDDNDTELCETSGAFNAEGYFRVGANAAYNLLSKEISEKDGEIKRMLESCRELNGVIEQWKKDFKTKDLEIERLKGLIKGAVYAGWYNAIEHG